MLAIRILVAGYEMPALTANKMEAYSNGITAILQDSTKAENLILKAAKVIEQSAAGNFNRDNIRTERFTEAVVDLAKESVLSTTNA